MGTQTPKIVGINLNTDGRIYSVHDGQEISEESQRAIYEYFDTRNVEWSVSNTEFIQPLWRVELKCVERPTDMVTIWTPMEVKVDERYRFVASLGSLAMMKVDTAEIMVNILMTGSDVEGYANRLTITMDLPRSMVQRAHELGHSGEEFTDHIVGAINQAIADLCGTGTARVEER